MVPLEMVIGASTIRPGGETVQCGAVGAWGVWSKRWGTIVGVCGVAGCAGCLYCAGHVVCAVCVFRVGAALDPVHVSGRVAHEEKKSCEGEDA